MTWSLLVSLTTVRHSTLTKRSLKIVPFLIYFTPNKSVFWEYKHKYCAVQCLYQISYLPRQTFQRLSGTLLFVTGQDSLVRIRRKVLVLSRVLVQVQRTIIFIILLVEKMLQRFLVLHLGFIDDIGI